MADFSVGTWITMEGTPEREGAAAEPYEATFPDTNGNACIRQVSCPQNVSTYFRFSNQVDLHNQARQFDLALEKKWITQESYFRLCTILVGMDVIDACKGLKMQDTKPTVYAFFDILAKDMLDYAHGFQDTIVSE